MVCGGTSGAKVELNLPRLFFKQIEIIGSTMGSYPEFADVTRLVGQGLAVQVDEVVDRADYPAALDRLGRGDSWARWSSATRYETMPRPWTRLAELARISAEAEAMWNEDMPVG